MTQRRALIRDVFTNISFSGLAKGLSVSFLLVFALSTQSGGTPSYGWDLQTHYAYAPAKLAEGSISGGMVSQMNQVDSAYSFSQTIPNGSGLSASQMQEIEDLITITFNISRDPGTGALSGRALTVIDDEDSPSVANLALPASFNGDWIPGVNKIVTYYASASPSQEPILEQAYLDMIELFLNNNPFPGWAGADLDAGNGYTWRNTAWKTLRMSNTLPSTERNLFGLSMFFCSGGQRLLKESHSAGLDSSTDDYHTTYKTAFNALTLLDENAFKWQLFNTVRLQLDKSIVGYPETGQNGLITIDGGVIHHTGHHTHYASYSFLNMILPHRVMTEAGFTSSLTAESVGRFRKAAVAWSWTDTNGGFPVHYLLRPTHPSVSISGGKSIGNTVAFLQGAAQLTAAYQSGDSSLIGSDLEMAYPAIVKAGAGSFSLPIAWRSISLPASSSDPVENWTNRMEGHHTFQVMGGAIHRQNNWMASVRGAHTYRRGGEAYEAMGGITHHHEMNMRGSLLLITEGKSGRSPNSADSGYYYQGWDHNFYPNVTTPIRTLADHLYWRTSGYFSGAATFTGGANLFDNGSWFYVPSDGKYRKSAFFFGNRITMVTSDINYSTDSRGIITGLIQQGAPNFTSYPITLDGTTRSGTGSWSLTAGGNHKITDINGNGYYIHPGAPAIEAVRSIQEWTYGLSSYWTGPGSMPSYVYKEDFVDDVNAGYFNPTVGNYSTVYFDHGTSAANESLAYTVLVKPAAGELDTLASNLSTPGSEPFTLDTSNNRHLLYDVATDTYAATLFTSGQTINQGGLISASRAGAYMWRTAGSTMYISCGSSDMGNTAAFQLVVQGEWSLTNSYDTLNPTVSVAGGNTTITLPYRQFAKQGVELTFIGNYAPTFDNLPLLEVSATEDVAYSASISNKASDADGDLLTFSKISGPAWLNVATNGVLSGMPSSTDVGLNSWVVQVSDGTDTDSATLYITVNADGVSEPTYPPSMATQSWYEWIAQVNVGSINRNSGDDGGYYDATALATVATKGGSIPFALTKGLLAGGTPYSYYWRIWIDLNHDGDFVDADELVYSTPVASSNMVSGSFTLPATYPYVGATRMRISMKWDDEGIPTSTETFGYGEVEDYTVIISTPNIPPVFNSDPTVKANAKQDLAYNSSIATDASDANGDAMTFAKVSGPGWLNVAMSGALSGTPGLVDIGLNSWIIQVTDGMDTNTTTLEITVGPPNTAPVFNSNPIVEANNPTEDLAYSSSITNQASDVDGDPLTFSKVSGPGWLNVASNGNINGTPGLENVGTNSWTVQVSDGIDADSVTLNILVNPAAGEPFYHESKATVSSYEWISNVTVGSINRSSGDDGGYYDATASSTTEAKGASVPFSLTKGLTGGEAYYYFWRIWIDLNHDGDFVDADELVYSTPVASSNMVSGSFVLPDTYAYAGPTRMRVSMKWDNDGVPLPAEIFTYGEVEDYTIDIASSNAAPAFTSDPIAEAPATKDALYSGESIADNALDDDGDLMTFTKVSGPGWLNVATNGVLSGTPGSMDVGANSWTVQVSDGMASNTAALQISVNSDGDWDNDGIPDAWELQYFGHETNAVTSLDDDEDGYDTLDEYIAGFDPTNALSYPVITGFEVSADGSEWIISWPAETADRAYDVMSANSLTGTFTNLVGTCIYPQNSYTNAVNPGDTNQFYRIYFRLQP